MLRATAAALAYEAPFVIDKLIKDGTVGSQAEGDALFMEVKRYLVLVGSQPGHWDMYSARVDEAWHQFILFTRPYSDYCHRHFGRYLHHSPNLPMTAPVAVQAGPKQPIGRRDEMSFAEFARRYRECFGLDLPELWRDHLSLVPGSRVSRAVEGPLGLRHACGRTDLSDGSGALRFSVNEFGRYALEFIATTASFYVRELPGGLEDGEKVAMAEALVRAGVLKVAA